MSERLAPRLADNAVRVFRLGIALRKDNLIVAQYRGQRARCGA